MGAEAPKLAELKSRQCSIEEMQAALVKLIELHNALDKDIQQMIAEGRIRSRSEAAMNRPYGL